jgi:hypothetical protein
MSEESRTKQEHDADRRGQRTDTLSDAARALGEWDHASGAG